MGWVVGKTSSRRGLKNICSITKVNSDFQWDRNLPSVGLPAPASLPTGSISGLRFLSGPGIPFPSFWADSAVVQFSKLEVYFGVRRRVDALFQPGTTNPPRKAATCRRTPRCRSSSKIVVRPVRPWINSTTAGLAEAVQCNELEVYFGVRRRVAALFQPGTTNPPRKAAPCRRTPRCHLFDSALLFRPRAAEPITLANRGWSLASDLLSWARYRSGTSSR
jgi:hypothetical protein